MRRHWRVNRFLMTDRNGRPYKEIGQRIADLRRQEGRRRGLRLTQKVVAEHVGVAEGTVTAWEIGKQRPEGENLKRLASLLRTTPEFILGVEAGGPELHHLPDEDLAPPNYEGLGIEIPERDRLKPGPMRMFDRFVHRLLDMGLGREDIEHWGRTVLAPIAHLNTLHKGREVSEAATEEEQTWILEHNIDAALRIIERRKRG